MLVFTWCTTSGVVLFVRIRNPSKHNLSWQIENITYPPATIYKTSVHRAWILYKCYTFRIRLYVPVYIRVNRYPLHDRYGCTRVVTILCTYSII